MTREAVLWFAGAGCRGASTPGEVTEQLRSDRNPAKPLLSAGPAMAACPAPCFDPLQRRRYSTATLGKPLQCLTTLTAQKLITLK